MLEKYQFLSTDWLLFGKGSMYSDIKMQTLFDENDFLNRKDNMELSDNEPVKPEIEFQQFYNDEKSQISLVPDKNKPSEVEKIVWFYANKTFKEFFPQS
jgi:hypothetical protein